ncbi:sodium-independent sulfate anion transporter-like isoform X1 [Ceratina calcarata]|uniref:Sodium-independent sulfate anion transporter-like isoform X1 n=1 Tax=Ceratina calcarata TaxID=156304 RepID=A0AAJ7WEC4_9HYME|nr:sodium-independent sulfate anion transporter-like isoform X1 [Ceratina calcarata]XP_026673072.1 sodium-independent sulfate anion transporter-like isoform X1 [Ceratina calcarata]XP_026673073.1 sodium-independent sulfate anion transporter-like isoform X1 [Ceratina calcarata]XP_026673074.1 sodium-independent sulfate anion transporter-like isoform X1 [Ceratina calcarata]XP_026673075.1 sodium-independent sulfate anion transporter-like isoform X1 [Ceratina calcarata]XP_026673076.1 sodium-independ
MAKYNVQDCDVETGKQVRLTGYTNAAFEDPSNDNDPDQAGSELENRLNSVHVSSRDGKTIRNDVPQNPERDLLYVLGRKWLYERVKRCCKKKMLYKRVPITDWLPKYRKDYVVSDLVAGITVGLTVIPQAIAYANVAGLPLQYGLYSSFMACFVYTILGSCKDVPVGPTAIIAILTRETLQKADLGPDFAVLLTLISGCACLLMGILHLGFLLDFISGPVSVGFTSAAAIIIATSQIKDILGISIDGSKFVDVWHNIFENIGETKLWDTALGIACIVVLLLLRKIKDIPFMQRAEKVSSRAQVILRKSLWLLSTARNILVVLASGIMCYLLESRLGSAPVRLTGHVKQGLPEFRLPPFQTVHKNETYNFIDMVSALGSGCLVVPLLSLLETISIAKVFNEGKPIDATQEMLALGACNVVSAFVSSMPVSGGLSRGAVNHSSGVRTTLGGVYTGVLVLVSLQFLTPYLYFIPNAALAAIIIAAVIFMVELHVIKPIWRTKKIDLIPAVATFLCCLFVRLELGIVIGIGVNVLFLLYASARPSLRVHKATSVSGCEYLVITPDRSLVFPGVEYVRAVISKQGTKQGTAVPVVIDSTHIQAADFTAAKGIKSLTEDFTRRGQPLIFHNLKPSIIEIFKGVKPSGLRCSSNEVELNDCLKELSNVSTATVNRC